MKKTILLILLSIAVAFNFCATIFFILLKNVFWSFVFGGMTIMGTFFIKNTKK